ncbi:hypothetical protein AVEN_170779-1 [Araneus ventricosus]|uniref:Uncharacterized protein n=1 Tax=Araneus ventricosus TaxID=182803 RepID=A0A4Y2F589_ARAVE|nr:hypothetical protein AVEN_170779-1 [Araneus ventricosus]
MKKRSYDVPTLLKAKPLMFFKVKKICQVPTSDAEGIACACAIRRSCELTNQSDSTCVRWYHGIEAPVFKTRTESETTHDDRLICCARSRNTSLPSVKRDVRNDRGTRIRPLLSVEKKPLTSRGRKAKRSQPNRGTRIDPFICLYVGLPL